MPRCIVRSAPCRDWTGALGASPVGRPDRPGGQPPVPRGQVERRLASRRVARGRRRPAARCAGRRCPRPARAPTAGAVGPTGASRSSSRSASTRAPSATPSCATSTGGERGGRGCSPGCSPIICGPTPPGSRSSTCWSRCPPTSGPRARRDWDPVGEIAGRLERLVEPLWEIGRRRGRQAGVRRRPMQGRPWAERQAIAAGPLRARWWCRRRSGWRAPGSWSSTTC